MKMICSTISTAFILFVCVFCINSMEEPRNSACLALEAVWSEISVWWIHAFSTAPSFCDDIVKTEELIFDDEWTIYIFSLRADCEWIDTSGNGWSCSSPTHSSCCLLVVQDSFSWLCWRLSWAHEPCQWSRIDDDLSWDPVPYFLHFPSMMIRSFSSRSSGNEQTPQFPTVSLPLWIEQIDQQR